MPKEKQPEEKVIEKLDAIARLLEDLFILEASRAAIPKEEIRKILRIDKNRIGRISKHIEP